MSTSTRLDDARAILERAQTVDAWSRSAALLARHALEDAVRDAIEDRYGKTNRPTFSSQLVVLRNVVSPKVAKKVAWTWSALSAATHAHSYELPATAGELHRWIDTVDRLLDEISSE